MTDSIDVVIEGIVKIIDYLEIPKIFSFENGGVGVNFLGFKARAGLGGLLTGNAADGGLFAEAGTPFGQHARAGLGGNVGSGRSAGGLYADATAGGGVGAGAGLAGSVGPEGSFGGSYAGASAGKAVYKEKVYAAPNVGGEVSAPVVEKHVHVSSLPLEKEVDVEKTLAKETPRKTYIERTVIPNYQEKTIYVPSYVEKTIKVPTVVAQKVKVPTAPTVIEKSVESPPENVSFGASVDEGVPPTVYVQKFKHHRHRLRPFRKYVILGGGYGGGEEGGFGAGAVGGGVSAVGGGSSATSGGDYGSTVTLRKTVNPQLFNDIFNIPISTLGAVNKLVNGLASGSSGSVSVSKTASVSKSVDV